MDTSKSEVVKRYGSWEGQRARYAKGAISVVRGEWRIGDDGIGHWGRKLGGIEDDEPFAKGVS